MEYQNFYNILKDKYSVDTLSFLDEHLIFTSFMATSIRDDQQLLDEQKLELLKIIDLAYNRLHQKYKNIDQYFDHCLLKQREHQHDNPHLAHYYMVLSALFSEESLNSSSYEFRPFEVHLELVKNIDDSYSEALQAFIQEELEDLY